MEVFLSCLYLLLAPEVDGKMLLNNKLFSQLVWLIIVFSFSFPSSVSMETDRRNV